jgi:hypothetical protein
LGSSRLLSTLSLRNYSLHKLTRNRTARPERSLPVRHCRWHGGTVSAIKGYEAPGRLLQPCQKSAKRIIMGRGIPSSQRSAPRPKPPVPSIQLFNYRNAIHGHFVPARVARNSVRRPGGAVRGDQWSYRRSGRRADAVADREFLDAADRADRTAPKPATISTLALGPLHPSQPTLAARVRTPHRARRRQSVELASGWERLITRRVMNADAAPRRPTRSQPTL